MKIKWKPIVAAMCVATMCIGCGPKNPDTSDKKEEVKEEQVQDENKNQGKLDVLNPSAYGNVDDLNLEPGSYISIIGKTSGHAFWDEISAGVQQAEDDLNEKLGYTGDQKIKVNYSAPSKGENVEDQINILDEELARNPVAVGMAIIDSTACQVQFDLASENGIPIVAFDSGSDYQYIQAMCSTDNIDMGKGAAVKLASLIDENGEVAVFVHDSDSTTAQQREAGFIQELQENYPEVSSVVIYHMDQLEEVSKVIAAEKNTLKEEGTEDILAENLTQEEVIQYFLEKNPNIKGCFSTNVDVTQTLVRALDSMKKQDMKVIGIDGGKEQMKLLEEGKVDGLYIQNPYGMGYAAVVSAARASLGMGNQAVIDSGMIWVTQENMDKKDIKKMLY